MKETAQLMLPGDYVRDATRHIKKAKTRISVISLVLNRDHTTNNLLDALASAAKRDIQVDVAADMFTYAELSGQFIPSHYYSKRVRSTTTMSRKLTTAGVHFHWLGRLSPMTFSGRTHAKWCVVDDTVYSFGGVNLYDRGIANTDYVFKLTDEALASHLIDTHRRIVRDDRGRLYTRSHKFPTELGDVLIDGGMYGDSIIYKRACQLAEQASSILLVSQYCPSGKLSKLLKQKNARLFFNTNKTASGLNKVLVSATSKLTGFESLYKHDNYLHAKFIVFTMPDGKKIAITGSHNFVHGGVLLGTREIALETDDASIIQQLEAFHQEYIA